MSRVDVASLLIAIAGALAIAAVVAGVGYLLGAPAGVLGALTSAVVSASVGLIYTRRQRAKAAEGSAPSGAD
jgi:hypothetical protein